MEAGGWQVQSAKGTCQAYLGHQQEESNPAPARCICRVYKEAFTGSCPIGLQVSSTPHHYLKSLSLEQLLGARKASGNHVPRAGEGLGACKCRSPAHGSMGGHVYLMTFPSRVVPPRVEGAHHLQRSRQVLTLGKPGMWWVTWWFLCSVLGKNLALEEPGCWEAHKARNGVQKSVAENQLQE